MTLFDITECDLFWIDPYTKFDGFNGIKSSIFVTETVTLLVGSFLVLGIIYFESQGQDPKKRGLLNQVTNNSG